MRRLEQTTFLALFFALTAFTAEANPVKYAGPHPRNGTPQGGYCFIQAIHVHPFPPIHADALYRVHNGVYFFIADPAPFGYDGPRYSYYGPHPVVVNVALGFDDWPDRAEYCYFEGPHFHAYAPPPNIPTVKRGDVYYYSGDYPPEYERGRPVRAQVNQLYHPYSYERPVVVGPPPSEYRGPIIGVQVNLPVPAVVVGAPARPPVMVVGSPPPPMRVVEPPRPAVYRLHDKHEEKRAWREFKREERDDEHDRGKHKWKN